MSNRLFSALVLGVAAGTLWSLTKQYRARQAALRPAGQKPVPVEIWEGEGGALPVTGAQLGPDPVVMPAPTEHTADHPDSVH